MTGFFKRLFGEGGQPKSLMSLDKHAGYLNRYQASGSISPEQWSKTFAGYPVGTIIFGLRPSNSQTVSLADSATVYDLFVVVSHEGQQLLCVAIGNTHFEARQLDSIMLEKALKAILDHRDFSYIALAPASPLSETKVQQLVALGRTFVNGGSRQSFAAKGNSTEPAEALLIALDVIPGNTVATGELIDLTTTCQTLLDSLADQRQQAKFIALST